MKEDNYSLFEGLNSFY